MKDWAQKLADKIHSAPWTPGETRELILRHLPAPSHSEVEPPWAKLRPFQTKQGVVRDKHGNMIAEAWGITNGEMICAALNGESK